MNPWIALRAATDRRTKGGDVIGACEVIDRAAALALYQARPPAIGMPADLILYDWPEDSGALGQVGLTLMGGAIAWQG